MDRRWRWDLLLAGIALLAAGLLWLMTRSGGPGSLVVVTRDGAELGRYPLAQDIQVTFGEADYNVLTISGGEAAVTGASCGDHTCVRTGAVSRTGETIVCLPHRLVIRVEGGGDGGYDIMAR